MKKPTKKKLKAKNPVTPSKKSMQLPIWNLLTWHLDIDDAVLRQVSMIGVLTRQDILATSARLELILAAINAEAGLKWKSVRLYTTVILHHQSNNRLYIMPGH